MYEQVPADLLQVEMDLGWVQYAGQQPLEYVKKYAGRLPLLHLKDFREGKPGEAIDTVELGQGDLALLEVIEAGSKADVEWIIVEQDRCANPPLQSVKTSMDWLKENYLTKF
jgi:sugar phosphate isomerase/epimerase